VYLYAACRLQLVPTTARFPVDDGPRRLVLELFSLELSNVGEGVSGSRRCSTVVPAQGRKHRGRPQPGALLTTLAQADADVARLLVDLSISRE
jgi:hypothetical protein